MWHVYVNGDANSPYYFDDQGALNTYLNGLAAGSIATVEEYEVTFKGRTVYGVTGAPDWPNPPTPKPALATFNRTHYKRQ